jgi:hypothetical protein
MLESLTAGMATVLGLGRARKATLKVSPPSTEKAPDMQPSYSDANEAVCGACRRGREEPHLDGGVVPGGLHAARAATHDSVECRDKRLAA